MPSCTCYNPASFTCHNPHVPATYSIFTTLKFPPKGKRPSLHTKPPSGKQSKQNTSFLYKESSNNQSKKSVPDTSFYYKDNSSSNYDLTLARKEKEVVAEVHEASPKVGNKRMNLHKFYDKLLFWFAPIQSVRSVGEGGSSPVPLLPPRVERAEGFYSFRTLQERCASASCQPNPQLILHLTIVSLHLQSESSLSGAERWSRGQNPGRQTQNSNFQEVQAGGKILNNEIFL